MIATIPTRRAVSDSWEAYSTLCKAAALDPALIADEAFQTARDRARQRWSAAFAKWDGK